MNEPPRFHEACPPRWRSGGDELHQACFDAPRARRRATNRGRSLRPSSLKPLEAARRKRTGRSAYLRGCRARHGRRVARENGRSGENLAHGQSDLLPRKAGRWRDRSSPHPLPGAPDRKRREYRLPRSRVRRGWPAIFSLGLSSAIPPLPIFCFTPNPPSPIQRRIH